MNSHQEYFARAYRTGTDIWTLMPYDKKGKELLEVIEPGAMILDVGAGRGVFDIELAKKGYKVIGLDYVKEIVERNNNEVKELGLKGKAAFILGDVFDIGLADRSVDAIIDFGLLQHLSKEDWGKYKSEIARVLKPGGYYYSALLSRKTPIFQTFSPKDSDGDFKSDGVLYHFFTNKELNDLFVPSLSLVSERIEYIKDRDSLAYIISLYKKNQAE